jgi:hypothetical protein
MRFYTPQHRFYGGVANHARTRARGGLDAAGGGAFRGTGAAAPPPFREALAPSRDGLARACAGLLRT